MNATNSKKIISKNDWAVTTQVKPKRLKDLLPVRRILPLAQGPPPEKEDDPPRSPFKVEPAESGGNCGTQFSNRIDRTRLIEPEASY